MHTILVELLKNLQSCATTNLRTRSISQLPTAYVAAAHMQKSQVNVWLKFQELNLTDLQTRQTVYVYCNGKAHSRIIVTVEKQ